MEKQTKITYLLLGLTILFIILHNTFSAFFNMEEPISFILAFVLVLGFAISVIYSLINYARKGEPKDLWKLGWIGLFGLLGLVGSTGLYGFFGFLGFFGAKGWKRIKGHIK